MIGRFSARYQLWQRITDTIHTAGGSAFDELVKAATAAFGAVSDVGIVAVLTVYFLVDTPRIRATLYRFVPNSRRPRGSLIGDEIMAKVGDDVFGNVVTSVIAGAATFVWCTVFGVPYPLLLGAFVALLDLLPYGSSVAGFIVAVVALTVSIPVSIATIGFYIAFRSCEDYILVPKVIGRAVKVPAVVTVVAVLIGGSLLGVVELRRDPDRRGTPATYPGTVVSHPRRGLIHASALDRRTPQSFPGTRRSGQSST